MQSIIQPNISEVSSSPIERMKDYLQNSGVSFDDPSTLPDVHILELTVLADEISCMIDNYHKANPALKRELLQQHYISAGVEDTPSIDAAQHNHNDLEVGTDAFFDAEEEQSFAKYLAEISSKGTVNNHAEEEESSSLVDAIAADATTNISVMKLDVDSALRDTESSQLHLINYKEFIEKKKKQRIQCLRDIQIHCCTCQGPHITKPPFSHGKDYRREPLHEQHQGNKCLFLKKKRSELGWLDETIGNYDKNNKRFELEIEKRKAETQSRKENMKESLANMLRLMEVASLEDSSP